MKIAFWSTYPGGGGSELLWHRASQALAERGHAIFFSTYRSAPNAAFIESSKAWRAGADLKSRSASLPRRLLRKAGHSPRATKLKVFAPDLLVVNSDSTGWTQDEALVDAIRSIGCPYAVVLHGSGGFFEDDFRAKAQELYENAAAVCMVSEYTRAMVQKHLALSLPQARVIRNPVGESIRKDVFPEFPECASGLVFATASRLNCYTKGQDYLLEAFADPALRGRAWQLNIYGGGGHENYLRELVRHYGLESKVFLRGHVSDIAQIWKTAHVHVMPSLTESAPIALVEAMLCARPSVATRVSGIPEWLIDGENGYLAETANPWNLMPALAKTLDNADRLREMGLAARTRALSLIGEPVEDFISILTGEIRAKH